MRLTRLVEDLLLVGGRWHSGGRPWKSPSGLDCPQNLHKGDWEIMGVNMVLCPKPAATGIPSYSLTLIGFGRCEDGEPYKKTVQ